MGLVSLHTLIHIQHFLIKSENANMEQEKESRWSEPNAEGRWDSTYVKPVLLFMPARTVDTKQTSALFQNQRNTRREHTQNSVKTIVYYSTELSPQTKSQ